MRIGQPPWRQQMAGIMTPWLCLAGSAASGDLAQAPQSTSQTHELVNGIVNRAHKQ